MTIKTVLAKLLIKNTPDIIPLNINPTHWNAIIDDIDNNHNNDFVNITTTDNKCFIVNKEWIDLIHDASSTSEDNPTGSKQLQIKPLITHADMSKEFTLYMLAKHGDKHNENHLQHIAQDFKHLLRINTTILQDIEPAIARIKLRGDTTIEKEHDFIRSWGIRIHYKSGESLFSPGLFNPLDRIYIQGFLNGDRPTCISNYTPSKQITPKEITALLNAARNHPAICFDNHYHRIDYAIRTKSIAMIEIPCSTQLLNFTSDRPFHTNSELEKLITKANLLTRNK